MAHHRGRLDTVRTPQVGQGDLHRKQDRLDDRDVVEPGPRLQLLQQRPVDQWAQRGLRALQRRAKSGLTHEQLTRHAHPFRPLPREHECEPARAFIHRNTGGLRPGCVALGEAAQAVHHVGRRLTDEGGAMPERGAVHAADAQTSASAGASGDSSSVA